ncbi:unnamed protein product [Cunninghamella echinulata]
MTKKALELTALLQKYDDFINFKLKPNLKLLKSQIEMIQKGGHKELKTMVDLDINFMLKLWCKTLFPDTTYIYVNVGFGFHVQFTLNEAIAFIDKKEQRLQRSAEKYSEEADKIRAHIKMVLEAMAEALNDVKN